jgi:hypothetical protein
MLIEGLVKLSLNSVYRLLWSKKECGPLSDFLFWYITLLRNSRTSAAMRRLSFSPSSTLPLCPELLIKPVKGSFGLKILSNWHHMMVTLLSQTATFLTRVLVLGNPEVELATWTNHGRRIFPASQQISQSPLLTKSTQKHFKFMGFLRLVHLQVPKLMIVTMVACRWIG